MRIARIAFAALTTILLFGVLPSDAQTVTETAGAIKGTVTDSSKAALPGTLVTLIGVGEMGTPQTTTEQGGNYHFTAVPPGDYTLKFTRDGFSAVEQNGIHITVGFLATVDVSMKPGSVDQTITVEGSAPVLDTTNTSVNTTFDSNKIEDLPGSRDVWAVLSQTPAISMAKPDVGGSGALNQQVYTAYGLSANVTGTNRNDVEGIRVGAANGSSDNYFADAASFSEINVQTVGSSAEASNPGTLQQYVSKTGGNQYHGDFYGDFKNKAMEATNIDSSQIAAGLAGSPTLSVYDTNRLVKFYNLNADLGGYIKKDKLWFYGAFRYESVAQAYPWLTDTFAPISSPVATVKGTYNLTPRNRFVGYYQNEHLNQPNYFSGGNSLPVETSSAVEGSYFPVTVYKGEYDATFSQALYLEVRYGAYLSGYSTYNKSSDPRIADTGLNTVKGACCNTGLTRNRPQANATLSYFKNGWGVSHTVKIGVEGWVDHLISPFGGEGDACDCVSTLVNGAPSSVQIYQGLNTSKNDLWTFAGYINDNWQVKPKLALNLGVRLDHYKPQLPAQTGPAGQQFAAASNFVTFNNWAPRLGFTYAIDSKRKNLIKMHYGLAYLYPGVNFTSAFNPNASGWYNTYKWTTDTNNNGQWDPGEQGALTGSSGGTTSTRLDPNIKNAYFNQATAYYEREVASNFGVRTGFVWYGERHVYGVINANLPLSLFTTSVPLYVPNPDGTASSATVQAYDIGPVGSSAPAPLNTEQNIPFSNNAFYTWEITATKRDTGRWSLLASFAETWSHLSNVSTSANFNPNGFINTYGGYNNFGNWQAKLSGTVHMRWGFEAIPTVRIQSGTPFARTFTATSKLFVPPIPPAPVRTAFIYGSSTPIMVEPLGAERTSSISLVDTRIQKQFKFKERYLISGFFDVYNIFNTNADQTLTTTSGASYLRPTAITGPRILRVGGKFNF